MPQLNKMMIHIFRNSRQVLWFRHYQTFLINYSARKNNINKHLYLDSLGKFRWVNLFNFQLLILFSIFPLVVIKSLHCVKKYLPANFRQAEQLRFFIAAILIYQVKNRSNVSVEIMIEFELLKFWVISEKCNVAVGNQQLTLGFYLGFIDKSCLLQLRIQEI